jgi:hypothetical protein
LDLKLITTRKKTGNRKGIRKIEPCWANPSPPAHYSPLFHPRRGPKFLSAAHSIFPFLFLWVTLTCGTPLSSVPLHRSFRCVRVLAKQNPAAARMPAEIAGKQNPGPPVAPRTVSLARGPARTGRSPCSVCCVLR